MLFIEMILFAIRETKDEGRKRQLVKHLEKDALHNISTIPQPKKLFQPGEDVSAKVAT